MDARGCMTNRTLFSDSDENVLTILAQLDHLRKIQHPAFLVNSPVLSAQQIATFVETAYWSSLVANEGRTTSVRMAAVMRRSFAGLPQFSAPVPFDEGNIAKLAPAVPPRELEVLGGMRHQSAARFVGANHKCAALVVSEDGPCRSCRGRRNGIASSSSRTWTGGVNAPNTVCYRQHW
jgi:hypothetical protein